MFYTKVGEFVAALSFLLGGLQVVVALGVAVLGNDASGVEYFGRGGTGGAINTGMYGVLVGVVIGILAEISRAVAARGQE